MSAETAPQLDPQQAEAAMIGLADPEQLAARPVNAAGNHLDSSMLAGQNSSEVVQDLYATDERFSVRTAQRLSSLADRFADSMAGRRTASEVARDARDKGQEAVHDATEHGRRLAERVGAAAIVGIVEASDAITLKKEAVKSTLREARATGSEALKGARELWSGLKTEAQGRRQAREERREARKAERAENKKQREEQKLRTQQEKYGAKRAKEIDKQLQKDEKRRQDEEYKQRTEQFKKDYAERKAAEKQARKEARQDARNERKSDRAEHRDQVAEAMKERARQARKIGSAAIRGTALAALDTADIAVRKSTELATRTGRNVKRDARRVYQQAARTHRQNSYDRAQRRSDNMHRRATKYQQRANARLADMITK